MISTPEAANDIAFYLQVYRDYSQAKWCLEHLRAVYPDAPVSVISDGDPDWRWPELCERNQVSFQYGERLYLLHHGGRMIHRMMGMFCAMPAKVYVKIDTDTFIHRKITQLPEEDGIYGNPIGQGKLPTVQGGCILFPRATAMKIHDSGVFLNPELSNTDLWGIIPLVKSEAQRLGLIRFEWVLGHGCRTLGIPPRRHEEVWSKWHDEVDNSDLRYAFTHPFKIGPLYGFRRVIRRSTTFLHRTSP